MTNSINALWSEVLADELARGGVRDVVISPGSRSTPLVLAFAAQPDLRTHSVIDERSAGFFALGLIRSTLRPVVVLSTSGTAAANYLPAICEADLSNLALIVMSADRPAPLRDTGASQSMRQSELFGSRVRWSHELLTPEPRESSFEYLRATIAKTVQIAHTGPVHLNIPFRKPLEPQQLAPSHPDATDRMDLLSPGVAGHAHGRPWVEQAVARTRADDSLLQKAATLLDQARQPLLLVGSLDWPAPIADFMALSDHTHIPMAAETLSGLRSSRLAERVIDLDLLTAAGALQDFVPDVLVIAGRWPIQWSTQAWLRGLPNTTRFVWLAGDPTRPTNPEHRGGIALSGELGEVLQSLSGACRAQETDARPLLAASREIREAFDANVGSTRKPIDGRVIWELQKHLNDGDSVVVSSSMPLRDAELFWRPTSKSIAWFANRGLNGIDGVISLAAGVATGRGGRTFLIIGDVAFTHDIGALDTLARLSENLTVIVVNNSGGAIFSHLPLAHDEGDTAVFQENFSTPPRVKIQKVAAAYQLPSTFCADLNEFRGCLNRQNNTASIIEVITDSDIKLRQSLLPSFDKISAHQRPRAKTKARPVVLLHGFTGDSSAWPEDLFDPTRDVIAIDLLGHGTAPNAPESGTWSMEACVEHVMNLLQPYETFDLVGYSMGGRVAVAIAATHPSRIGRLVTLGGSPGLESESDRTSRIARDNALSTELRTDGLHKFLSRWMALPIFSGTDKLGEDWRRSSFAQRLQNSSKGLANALVGFGTGAQPSYWSQLSHFQFPCLFLAGAEDPKFVEIARDMATRTPTGESATIADAGHAAHYERPTEVAQAIYTFLNEGTETS